MAWVCQAGVEPAILLTYPSPHQVPPSRRFHAPGAVRPSFFQQAARLSVFFRAVTCRGTGQHLQPIARPLETVSFFALTLDLEHFVDLWVGVL